MASNSSLGAALGGEGTADKLPGRSLPIARNGGNAPALNALWDEYLWQLLRAWISVRGPQVGTSARHAVASTPELSRQVVAFLVGDPSIHA